jgi:hypothetical protein
MSSKQTSGIEDHPSLEDEPTATRSFTGDDGVERDDRFDDFDGQARTAVMRKDIVLALAQRTRSDGSDAPRLRPLVPAGGSRSPVARPHAARVATPPAAAVAAPVAAPPAAAVAAPVAAPPAAPVATSLPSPVETPLPPPLAPPLPAFPAEAIEAAFAEVAAPAELVQKPSPTRRGRRILGRLALLVLAFGVLGHHEVHWPAWAQRLPRLLTSVAASPSAIIGARPATPKPRVEP